MISVPDLRRRQYGKCLRGCVLTRFLWFRTFAHENLKNRLTWKQKVSVSAFCSATCKLLCISCLTEIRVVVFVTLKMPKALIASVIRVARPGGRKPPPSLGVRPKLALKEVVEGVFCCSESVRAIKRRRCIFSPGRSHASDRGERKPRGPKLALKEVVEGVFCCSESVRATKRRRRRFSLGRCHEVTEGYEDSRRPEARTERGRGNSHGLFLCERRDSNPYALGTRS